MSRSNYADECEDQWSLIRWRGQVASAIKGKRGQQLLREMATAMDAMPAKRLAAYELETPDGEFCALGVVAKKRGVDLAALDPEDYYSVARTLDIAEPLAREIVFLNDECGLYSETPETRFARMRQWVEGVLK